MKKVDFADTFFDAHSVADMLMTPVEILHDTVPVVKKIKMKENLSIDIPLEK